MRPRQDAHPRLDFTDDWATTMIPRQGTAPVLVACPDARPPAYQAVIGLHREGLLRRFLTAFYYQERPRLAAFGRSLAPARFERLDRALRRRFDADIPAELVRSAWSYDLALRIEGKLAGRRSNARREVARWRTRRFDAAFAKTVRRLRPTAVLGFSDVGSEFTLPVCRRLGIPYVLSMVHGDVREEVDVLRREAETSPEFFPMYLGDGALDLDELDWLHRRRLSELDAADLVLVPSEHIAETVVGLGTPRGKVRVIPYAADTRRFVPVGAKPPGESCTFLFAGGITQRKGIKYLLDAWQAVRRPGWTLQLLGALPADPRPLDGRLDGVELLGRVGHADVPALMAAADVFVFPSLFEGSAVVTYEALACGLPCVTTPNAGSVVRHGLDGLIVPAADSGSLGVAMVRLGTDPRLRRAMGSSARSRAEAFDWPRYHAAVNAAVGSVIPEAAGVVP